MDLKRRDFFKLIGVTTVGSDHCPGCNARRHNVVALSCYRDEEIIPGIANWYASYCRECPAGVREYRAGDRKVERRKSKEIPPSPRIKARLCARGHAALQDLYKSGPTQRGPMRREGPRGEGTFRPIGWEEAFSL